MLRGLGYGWLIFSIARRNMEPLALLRGFGLGAVKRQKFSLQNHTNRAERCKNAVARGPPRFLSREENRRDVSDRILLDCTELEENPTETSLKNPIRNVATIVEFVLEIPWATNIVD